MGRRYDYLDLVKYSHVDRCTRLIPTTITGLAACSVRTELPCPSVVQSPTYCHLHHPLNPVEIAASLGQTVAVAIL